MKAIYAAVMDVKHLRSTAMCRVSIEIPEEFFAEAAQYLNKRVLVTLSPDLGRGYGFVEPREEAPERPQLKEVPKVGPLCLLAVQWCKDERFRDWMRGEFFGDEDVSCDEEWAKSEMLELLQIGSRKELDTNHEAAENFHALFRIPYQQTLAEAA